MVAGATVSRGPSPTLYAAGGDSAAEVPPILMAEDAVPRAPSNRRLAALLMGGALFSKLLGFAREILFAHMLGVSLVADGFRGAITATLLPLSLLQNESVPAILIPMHRDWQKTGDAAERLAALSIALGLVALAIMLGVEMFGRWWVGAIVGGFAPDGQALTLDFVRIMALGMPASVMLNVLAAGEIALGRSRLATVRASLLNISVLIGIALLMLTGHLSALAWSFACAFNGLCAWGVWTLWREGILKPRGVRPALVGAVAMEFLHRLRPLLALPFAEQGQVWIERVLASRLATGTVASLDYARTLTDSAVLLISQPLGLALLSSAPATDTRARMEAIARPVLATALPASVFLGVFAPEVARFVFSRGAFNETAVMLTSEGLRGIAVGLWAATLGWILIRMLNSSGRNKSVAGILALAYAVNVTVNLVTWHFHDTINAGPLMLGLGEATRGFVLLGGIVVVLGCARPLLGLIAVAALPAAVMALLGLWIHQEIAGTFARLLAGGGACLLCIALAAALLMPSTCRSVLQHAEGHLATWGRKR